jgi:hypothetical protein
MKVDLVGKIKNTQLPRSKALLPMFEAVVNSFQAIEDGGETVSKPSIEIVVERVDVLPGIGVLGTTERKIGLTNCRISSYSLKIPCMISRTYVNHSSLVIDRFLDRGA